MGVRQLSIPAFLSANPQPVTGPAVLGGRRFRLRLSWSPRAGWGAGAWLLDLYDSSNIAIALSIPIVLSNDLWVGYRDDPRTPPGTLEVVRLSGEAVDPGVNDLGAAVVIRYRDPVVS